MREARVFMIIIYLILLPMLATAKKPWNPNRKQSLDTDWDKIDLYSFLYNINTINIDKNDICVTGKDYQNATTCEIVAELIRTINCTHYNSLCGMRDIINYNNNILKITEDRNNSIDICNKKIKLLNEKIKRFEFLLVQAADLMPDPQSLAQQQTTQQIKKIKNILDFTSCIDFNSQTTTAQTLPTTACSNITINQTQISPKQIQTDNLSAIVRDINSSINQPQSTTPNAIPSTKQNLVHINTVLKNEPSIRQAIDDGESKIFNELQSQNSIRSIEPLQKPPEQLPSQAIDDNEPPSKGHTIDDGTTPKLNIEENLNNTNEIINDITTPKISINELQLKPSIKTQNIDDIHLQSFQDIKPNKIQKKRKNKNKKYNNNNKKKRKKWKRKPKNQKHKKKQLLKDKPKEKILNLDELNQLIKLHAFSKDDYQFWMNQRVFQRPELTPFEYYEELYGKITDEKIKIWYNLYHAYL